MEEKNKKIEIINDIVEQLTDMLILDKLKFRLDFIDLKIIILQINKLINRLEERVKNKKE